MNQRNDSPKETLRERQIHHNPKPGQLVCPHCQTAFSITWRRYWDSPLGNYRCPECHQRSHATANAWWVWFIIFVAMTLVGIVGALFSAYVFRNRWLGAALLFMGYVFVGFTLDKWVDGHLRHLTIRS